MSRQFELSREAREDPEIIALARLVYRVVEGSDPDDLGGLDDSVAMPLSEDLIMSPYHFTRDEDDKDGAALGKYRHQLADYLKSPFFASLTPREQRDAVVFLKQDDGDQQWQFGRSQLEPATMLPGLENDHRVTESVPVTHIGRLVLSGALGAELLGACPTVEERLPRFRSPLESAVYLGGAAVAGWRYLQVERVSLSQTYYSQGAAGLSAVTEIGASVHGDFRTSRQIIPANLARDPLGREWPFSDVFEAAQVAGYHSIEPSVLVALLRYQVNYLHERPNDIYLRARSAVEEKAMQGEGAQFFADFGNKDGRAEAEALRRLIASGQGHSTIGDTLMNSIVDPSSPERLQLQALRSGVRFVNYDGETPISEFTLPVDEIDRYIHTLLTTAYGRTSSLAFRKIIDALVSEPEVK